MKSFKKIFLMLTSFAMVVGTLLVGGSVKKTEAVEATTQIVKYTIDSTKSVTLSSGTKIPDSIVEYSQTYTNAKGQMTASNSTTLKITNAPGYKLSSLILSMKSNKSTGSGSLIISNEVLISEKGFDHVDWNGSGGYTQSYVDIDVTDTIVGSGKSFAFDDNFSIKISASVKSLYIESYTIGYEKAETVSYNGYIYNLSDDGTEFDMGDPDSALLSPTKAGYEFGGWYLDKERTESKRLGDAGDTPVIKSEYLDSDGYINLYPKWIKVFNISYNADGGVVNPVENNKITSLGKVTLPTPESRKGYEFQGWYYNDILTGFGGDEYSPSKDITDDTINDITLVAKWEKVNILYSGSFNSQTGATNSYKAADVVLDNTDSTKKWQFSHCYYISNDFRLGSNDAVTIDNSKLWCDGDDTTGSYTIMNWEERFVNKISISTGSKYGTVDSLELFVSYDNGNSFERLAKLGSDKVENNTLSYTFTEISNRKMKFAFVVRGAKARIQLEEIKILGFDIPVTNITYNLDSGTCDVANCSKTVDGCVTLPTPTKDGFIFEGWFYNNNLVGHGGEVYYPPITESKSIILDAKWINQAQKDLIDTITKLGTAMSYGFKYTVKDLTIKDFKKVENSSDLQNGSKVLIVSVTSDNIRNAMENDFSSSNSGRSYALDMNGESAISKTAIWTIEKNSDGSYYLKDNSGSYLSINSTSNGTLQLNSTTGSKFHLSVNGNNAKFGSDDSHVIARSTQYNTFRNYKIADGGFDSSTEIYVYSDPIYKDCDFRLKCAVTGLTENFTSSEEWGIAVTAGDKTVYFSVNDTNTKVQETAINSDYNNTKYVIIDLGDVLNNIGRATTTFKVNAYVKIDGAYILSTSCSEHSVATLTQKAYEDNVTSVVNLYEILNSLGCYNA